MLSFCDTNVLWSCLGQDHRQTTIEQQAVQNPYASMDNYPSVWQMDMCDPEDPLKKI